MQQPAWLWPAAATVLAFVLVAPLFVIEVPPITDYPNHLARFFILAHPDDAVLSRMYAPHWTILPNLGMDIIGSALLRVTDPHIGGRILLALSLLVPVAGAVVYHRVVFGGRSYWPLASGLIAYNAAFFMGFMNFLLALGLALAGAAAWIALRRRDRPGWKALVGAIAAVATFFTHIFGLAFLLLLIGADEAATLWKRWSSGALTLRDGMKAAVPLLIALIPALVLYRLSPFGDVDTSLGAWRVVVKLMRLFSPFALMSTPLTIVTGVAVLVALIAMRRQLALAPGLLLVLGVLAIVYIAAPLRMKGGSYIDMRAAVMIALMLFAGLRPQIPRREAVTFGVALAALVVIRAGYVGATWIDTRSDLADLRAAMAGVEPGARVLVATGSTGEMTFAPPGRRVLPGIYRLTNHLPALLPIERKAFWPLLFANPAQQPITILPPFDRLSHPLTEPIDWSKLANEPFSAETLKFARYLVQWRANFDYVLLIDPQPGFQTIAKLSPLYDGDFAKLYRIDR
ncbi:hypothetical protein [Bradyrhizobium genosp. L]|uniref:hypothetical protein n=1 Tax=Bradyrhizobium genosp. L TaxID=83637 RepID=UPI001FEE4384|nr:hypothetical protein [Bradyrhizobium genosp. L]